jgi:hypothetical protein
LNLLARSHWPCLRGRRNAVPVRQTIRFWYGVPARLDQLPISLEFLLQFEVGGIKLWSKNPLLTEGSAFRR